MNTAYGKSWSEKNWWKKKTWKTDRKFLHCFVGKSHLKVKGVSFEKKPRLVAVRARGLEMQNSEYFQRNDGSLYEGMLSSDRPLSFPITFAVSLLRITANVQRQAVLIESYPTESRYQPSLRLARSNNPLNSRGFHFAMEEHDLI